MTNPYERYFNDLDDKGKLQVFMKLLNGNPEDKCFIIMKAFEFNKMYPEGYTGIENDNIKTTAKLQ